MIIMFNRWLSCYFNNREIRFSEKFFIYAVRKLHFINSNGINIEFYFLGFKLESVVIKIKVI